MGENIKEMSERLVKPTKDQLEANIKISHNWITAVNSGTFQGHVSLHIATLLDFLQKQNNQAVLDYQTQFPGEEKMPVTANVEFGRNVAPEASK